tara:strand:+ start:608 stop:784 length:177 start_codon:yes stop_codon:yes gene_type:complete
MNTDDIVNELSVDNNLGAEGAFKSVMQKKVGDALEIKRREVANNFVKTQVPEESDEDI